MTILYWRFHLYGLLLFFSSFRFLKFPDSFYHPAVKHWLKISTFGDLKKKKRKRKKEKKNQVFTKNLPTDTHVIILYTIMKNIHVCG